MVAEVLLNKGHQRRQCAEGIISIIFFSKINKRFVLIKFKWVKKINKGNEKRENFVSR